MGGELVLDRVGERAFEALEVSGLSETLTIRRAGDDERMRWLDHASLCEEDARPNARHVRQRGYPAAGPAVKLSSRVARENAMRIPVMRGIIDRRILVNYRVDPDVLSARYSAADSAPNW